MIKRLKIKNFRTHVDSILDFHSGVNVIKGNPDSGKTNIIRALNWALNNRPLGFRFHSDFVKDSSTEVKVVFQDEAGEPTTVRLSKANGKAKYILSGPLDYDVSEVEYKTIGSDVPEEIIKACNMNELNIQNQLDKPFLLSTSSSEVARTINRITDIEKVDAWVSTLTTLINTKRKTLLPLESQVGEVKRRLKELKGVEILKRTLEEAERMDSVLVKKSVDVINLRSLVENISVAKQSVQVESKRVSELERLVKEAEEISNSIHELSEKEILLARGIESCQKAYRNLVQINRNHLSKIKEFKIFLKSLTSCPFCNLCEAPASAHHLEVEELLEEGE